MQINLGRVAGALFVAVTLITGTLTAGHSSAGTMAPGPATDAPTARPWVAGRSHPTLIS
jgi:hypothetical protein